MKKNKNIFSIIFLCVFFVSLQLKADLEDSQDSEMGSPESLRDQGVKTPPTQGDEKPATHGKQRNTESKAKKSPGPATQKNSSSNSNIITNSSAPVFFESKNFSGSKAKGLLVFNEKVKINHKDLELLSQKAEIYFEPESQDISRIEAQGSVRAKAIDPKDQSLIKAKGDKAVYKPKENTLELSGKAELTKNNDQFKSDYIIYDLQTGEVKATKVIGTVYQ